MTMKTTTVADNFSSTPTDSSILPDTSIDSSDQNHYHHYQHLPFSYSLSSYLYPNHDPLEREESSSFSMIHPPLVSSNLFDPLIHPSGHLLPPPFMAAPFMHSIPSLIPPTHPLYLMHLPKPPMAAPFDPLLISHTFSHPSSHRLSGPDASSSSSHSPDASSNTFRSNLRNFLESFSSGLSSHATSSQDKRMESESKKSSTRTSKEQEPSGSIEEPVFSDDGRVEPLFGWLDASSHLKKP